jgi:nucleoside-diphosphate-sugar epimerase
MRVFVTGGAGFIGGAVCRQLRARGDEVVAVVRDPSRAEQLHDLGCEVRAGDLASPEALTGGMRGCDGAIHVAGMYRIGVAPRERPAMYEANVAATYRVLRAAIEVGVPRIVHVSTANAFGDTRGRIVDETYRRDVTRGFTSYYDETKYLAHVAAREMADAGAPISIAMPGITYGPGDHSPTGGLLRAAYEGRARFVPFPELGISPAHVEDVAAGILATLGQGRAGESYILAGPNLRLREVVAVAARVGGRRPPRWAFPTGVLRALSFLGPLAARAIGQPPNLAEIVAAGDGVTHWVSSTKASLKLGYAPRELEGGLRDAFGGHRPT